jgi:PAS domain S-box-containing protein
MGDGENPKLHHPGRDFHLTSANPAEGVILFDGKGTIHSLDAAAERLFGYGTDEAEGNPLSFVISWPDSSGFEDLINNRQSLSKDSAAKSQIVTARRKDGTSLPVELSIRKIRSSGRKLFSGLARQIPETGPTEKAIQVLAQRRKVIAELGIMVSTANTVREVAQSIVAAALVAADADACRIFLLRGDGLFQIEAEAASGKLSEVGKADSYFEFRTGEGLTGWMVEKGERIVVDDVLADPHWEPSKWADRAGLRSYASFPIRRGGEIIGVFSVLRKGIRPFDEADFESLDILSSYASISLEKTLLIEEGRQRASRLEIVDQIAKAVGATLEPDELFRTIIHEIRKAIPCERYSISTVDPITMRRHFWRTESDIPVDPPTPEESLIAGKRLFISFYEKRKPLRIDLIRERGPEHHLVRSGFRSTIVIPILQADRCVAQIALSSTKENAFTDEHEELLTAIASHLGTAISNANLYRTAEERTSRLEIVEHIAKAVSSALEPTELFRTIVQEIRNAVPCDRCVIATVDPETYRRHYWHIDSDFDVPPPSPSEAIEGGKRLFRHIYRPKKSLLVNYPADNDPWEHLAQSGVQSSLTIPILQDNRCVAHIAVSSLTAGMLTHEHEELLSAIAGHLGAAIVNTTLYRSAEERASRLEIVGKIAKAAGSSLEPDELFKTIISEIRSAIPCDRIVIGVLDPETNAIHSLHEYSDEPMVPLPPEAPERGVLTRAVNKIKGKINVPDLTGDPWGGSRLSLSGYRSALAIPIIQDGQSIAHVHLAKRKAGAFSQRR